MRRITKSQSIMCCNDKGFTLVETLIGMLILTIGILAIALMQSHSLRSNGLARISTDNTNNAMATIERLYSMAWEDNDTQTTPGLTEDVGVFQVDWVISTQVAPGVVTLADDLGQPTARLITVTSSYLEKSGIRRSTTLRYIKPRT